MQNNINNNERDAFNDIIRQKLEGHQVPVDPGTWDNIEQRLNTKKRKILPFWLWISGGAAVAVLALLFTLRPLTDTSEPIGKLKTPNVRQTIVNHESVTQTSVTQTHQQAVIQANRKTVNPVQLAQTLEPNGQLRIPKAQQAYVNHGSVAQTQQQPIVQANIKNGNQVQPKSPTSQQVETILAFDSHPAKPVSRDTTEHIGVADKIPVGVPGDIQQAETQMAQVTGKNKDTISEKSRYIPNSLAEEAEIVPIKKAKNKNSWLLAASVGSNGSVPTGNSNSNLLLSPMGDKNIVNATTSFMSIMAPNDFSNINYIPPVSVGIIVRKELDKVLGLESGLVYTYLLTTFENGGTQRNDARLHLHYIGVPLNLVARIWNSPKWEIYLSGGGMVEKGIQSVYVQKQYTGSQTYTTTATTGIDGLQWSVNGSVGTTYRIYHNIGLFFEPKLSYYFKNNQPISARTEYPVVFGVTAGVRFKFK